MYDGKNIKNILIDGKTYAGLSSSDITILDKMMANLATSGKRVLRSKNDWNDVDVKPTETIYVSSNMNELYKAPNGAYRILFLNTATLETDLSRCLSDKCRLMESVQII